MSFSKKSEFPRHFSGATVVSGTLQGVSEAFQSRYRRSRGFHGRSMKFQRLFTGVHKGFKRRSIVPRNFRWVSKEVL